MSAYAAERSQRISFRQQISERSEHAHGHVERSSELERPHVRANESRSCPRRSGFFSGQGEHFTGLVNAGHAIPTPGEWEVVVARATSEVQNRLRRDMKTSEHVL